MGLLNALSRARNGGSDDDPASLYECRNCGTSVSRRASDCPVCGSAEIASYRLE